MSLPFFFLPQLKHSLFVKWAGSCPSKRLPLGKEDLPHWTPGCCNSARRQLWILLNSKWVSETADLTSGTEAVALPLGTPCSGGFLFIPPCWAVFKGPTGSIAHTPVFISQEISVNLYQCTSRSTAPSPLNWASCWGRLQSRSKPDLLICWLGADRQREGV